MRHCDTSWLELMFQLHMAAATTDFEPPVFAEQAQELPTIHYSQYT